MKTSQIKIDHDIPIPVKERPINTKEIKARNTYYPFKDMVVGDSFFVPRGVVVISQVQSRVSTCARSYSDRHSKGWEFKTVRYKKGVRIWRIY